MDSYRCVVASYYPVYSFDPSCPYSDRQNQMSFHDSRGGIHTIPTLDCQACALVFRREGNTWLQQRDGGAPPWQLYSGMGFLNATSVMAPFVPIECYSGWLLDGSFGGPGAQGVDAGGVCNWRRMLGGTQYSNISHLPRTVGERGCGALDLGHTTDDSKYILETMAGALGDAQTRRPHHGVSFHGWPCWI